MFEILVKHKFIEIDGHKFTIYRKSIGLLFLLLRSLVGIDLNDFQKTNFYVKTIKKILKNFYKCSFFTTLRLKRDNVLFVKLLNEIISFNVPERKHIEEKGVITIDKLSNFFVFLVTQVIFYTGWTIEYILKQDFITLNLVLNNIRYLRFNNACDYAGGWDIEKYRRALGISTSW